MPILADIVDAVIGGDTHRDTRTLELVTPVGATVAATVVRNDEAGFAQAPA